MFSFSSTLIVWVLKRRSSYNLFTSFFYYQYWPICIMISTRKKTMSKFNVAFSPINIWVIMFKLFILNKEIGFAEFSYCYNYPFIIFIHSKLYFDIVCYWSSLIYTLGFLYRNWFNDFFCTNLIFPNKFLWQCCTSITWV